MKVSGLHRPAGALVRHSPGVLTLLWRCVDLASVSTEPSALQHAVVVCMQGCQCASVWQMRLAAATALHGIATAVCVPDPLQQQQSAAQIQSSITVTTVKPSSNYTALVMTPAVVALTQIKGAALQMLAGGRHDRVPAVRRAVRAAGAALMRVPDPPGVWHIIGCASCCCRQPMFVVIIIITEGWMEG
jgi:hypothetical protein